MKRIYLPTIAFSMIAFLLAACSGQAASQTQAIQAIVTNTQPVLPATQPATSIPTPTDTEAPPTPTQAATASPTATIQPSASSLPVPTFPSELTQTPGIIATATAYAAAVTADYQNNLALIGPLADLLQVGQYFHPVGTPVSSWHDLPLMPQATQGQEFKSDIYSYTAAASLDAAAKFYNSQSTKLNWTCFPLASGSAGTGSNAQHNINLICQGFAINITSFDNTPDQVIVVLNKAP